MTTQKPNFHFVENGQSYFLCVFCGDKCESKHPTERQYLPEQCIHPEINILRDTGLLCSNCYNWDFDLFKRHDSPSIRRDPLKHKSGRLLTKNGWLDEKNKTMEQFFK